MSRMTELAGKLQNLKTYKADLENDLKSVNEQIDEVIRSLVEEMINEEVDKFSYNGQLFYLKTEKFASAVPERKLELYQALKDNGYGGLVQETVNAATLKAFVKEQMEENDEQLPEWLEGLVRVYEEQTVAMRKSK